MYKTVREMLPGMEPMTTPKLPAGMEPMLKGKLYDSEAMKYTVRVSDGKAGSRFIYLNRVGMAALGEPEYVVPYFEGTRQLLALEVSDGKDPHALKLVNATGGRGRISAEYYDDLAQIFENAIPEWKRGCGKSLVFYKGTKISGEKTAIVFYEHGLSTPEHIDRAPKEEA